MHKMTVTKTQDGNIKEFSVSSDNAYEEGDTIYIPWKHLMKIKITKRYISESVIAELKIDISDSNYGHLISRINEMVMNFNSPYIHISYNVCINTQKKHEITITILAQSEEFLNLVLHRISKISDELSNEN